MRAKVKQKVIKLISKNNKVNNVDNSEKLKFISKGERHSTSTPGSDSPSSNSPVQVSFQENTQHQHKKFWIDGNILKRVKNVVNPTVLTDFS